MATQNTFSIEAMKACTGNAASDGPYLKWFLQECVSRLQSAAKDISDMADGQGPFAAGTLEFARARLGTVRLHEAALSDCAGWFNPGKPVIGKQFVDAGQVVAATAMKAEDDFKRLAAWLA